MRLREVIDLVELVDAIDDGYVRQQVHRTLPLTILNYTEKCMFDKAWTKTTLACRGLIYNNETHEVIARPFAKFFNYGEQGVTFDLSARVEVTNKLDGSLGILYPDPRTRTGYAVATRGSFTSDQAIHATCVLNRDYGDWRPEFEGVTYLFEIIYPMNRIVCDYGTADDLFLLGAVEIETGQTHGPDWVWRWHGPRTEVFEYKTLAGALEAAPREGAEGLVVRFLDTDVRVKIKQDDYVALHRILTGTNARSVWEFMAVNACKDLITEPKHWGTYLKLDPRRTENLLAAGPNWLDKLIENVPDEFYAWLRSTIDGINDGVAQLAQGLAKDIGRLRLAHGSDRKAFALAVRDHPHAGALFLLYEGRDITAYLWVQQYPEHEKPWMTRGEDAA